MGVGRTSPQLFWTSVVVPSPATARILTLSKPHRFDVSTSIHCHDTSTCFVGSAARIQLHCRLLSYSHEPSPHPRLTTPAGPGRASGDVHAVLTDDACVSSHASAKHAPAPAYNIPSGMAARTASTWQMASAIATTVGDRIRRRERPDDAAMAPQNEEDSGTAAGRVLTRLTGTDTDAGSDTESNRAAMQAQQSHYGTVLVKEATLRLEVYQVSSCKRHQPHLRPGETSKVKRLYHKSCAVPRLRRS